MKLLCLIVFLSPLSSFAGTVDCRRAPNVSCLADVGFELAMSSDPVFNHGAASTLLAQMGRVDEAHAVLVRFHTLIGKAEKQAVAYADSELRGLGSIPISCLGRYLPTYQILNSPSHAWSA